MNQNSAKSPPDPTAVGPGRQNTNNAKKPRRDQLAGGGRRVHARLLARVGRRRRAFAPGAHSGSFVYLPALEGRGSLLRVVEFYDGAPTAVEQMMAGSEDARPRVMCCILSYFDSPVERRRCGGDIYDLRGGATKGLAFDAATLWHVDGLVSRVPPGLVAMGVKSLRGGTAEQMERRGAGLAYERYRFDWQRAQDGVRRVRIGWAQPTRLGRRLVGGCGSVGRGDDAGDALDPPVVLLRGQRVATLGRSLPPARVGVFALDGCGGGGACDLRT